jgi:hypothetical protein
MINQGGCWSVVKKMKKSDFGRMHSLFGMHSLSPTKKWSLFLVGSAELSEPTITLSDVTSSTTDLRGGPSCNGGFAFSTGIIAEIMAISSASYFSFH